MNVRAMPLTGMTRRPVMTVIAGGCQEVLTCHEKDPLLQSAFGIRVHVDREITTMTYQIRMGLALPAVAKALGNRLGEKRFVALHDDLYGRKYYRLKAKDPSGTIESVEAKKAIWQSATEEFALGEFDPKTEWLISALIAKTNDAINSNDRSDLEAFTNALTAADAHQVPAGSKFARAGEYHRRALTRQIRVDYLPSSAAFPIDKSAEVSTAIHENRTALKLIKHDKELGSEDRAMRVQTALVSLLHRHGRRMLGEEQYRRLLDSQKVIDRLWASVRAMPRAHPRAELFANNLVSLCSYRLRDDARQAYIYLVAFENAYRDLTYKATTAIHPIATDPDCAYLRSLLDASPVTTEEIETCRRSLR